LLNAGLLDGLLGVAGMIIDSYYMLLWIIPKNSLSTMFCCFGGVKTVGAIADSTG